MVFMPYIINGVAISYAFSYFFSPINGAFDAILDTLGLEGLQRHWLSDPSVVNFVLAFVSLWRFSGYHVVLFLAALQSIPQDILEAAQIDGANTWQLFRYIQVPSIMLMVDFILFDNIRGALQVFDIPFAITNGGPGYASSTFTLYTINAAFKFSNFGLAATMAVAIMFLIVAIYVVQNFNHTQARPEGGQTMRVRGIAKNIILQAICLFMVVVVILPILLTLFASLKSGADMVNTSPLALPPIERITFSNFERVLSDRNLYVGLRNTVVILAISLVFNVAFGTVTAYIIERFNFRFKGFVVSLDESAILDGCSYWGLFVRIIFPLLKPATATVCIIKSITIINDMYIPYLYMPKTKLRTLTTYLMNYANAQQGSWQTLAAGIIVIMLPTVLLYIFFQKYILAGVVAGAVKE